MERRQSKRLAEQRNAAVGDVTPDGKRRDSVGAVIGVTPRRGAVNLQKAKAADAAAAAAARLDGFGAGDQRGITKRKKRKSKKKRRRDSYTPRSRESMHLLAVTEDYLNSEDEKNDREEKEEEAEEKEEKEEEKGKEGGRA